MAPKVAAVATSSRLNDEPGWAVKLLVMVSFHVPFFDSRPAESSDQSPLPFESPDTFRRRWREVGKAWQQRGEQPPY